MNVVVIRGSVRRNAAGGTCRVTWHVGLRPGCEAELSAVDRTLSNLFKAEKGRVMTEPVHRHHAVDYIEIPVVVAAAKAFYGSAFGWTFNDYGPDYAGIQDPARSAEIGGLAKTDAVRAGGPVVLLFSEDLDASVDAVVAAGGRIANGPYEFPGGRRFEFTDPSGNELGVWAEPDSPSSS